MSETPCPEVAAMLRDIEDELAHTRREVGKDAFAARVMAALAAVPRQQFVPPSGRWLAFSNGPVPIGHGQTISQPYIVALMTDLLAAKADDVILEVGTGSGYQAAVLARLVRRVVSIEIIGALAEAARARLSQLGIGNVEVRHGDGSGGWPAEAPYDGIMVTAATPRIPPALIAQLKVGGRLVAPVGWPGLAQTLQVLTKDAADSVSVRPVLTVAFVPLTRDLR